MIEVEDDQELIPLVTSDGQTFSVAKNIILQSGMISIILQDMGNEKLSEPIPIKDVYGDIFQKIVTWCTHHQDDEPFESEDVPLRERNSDDISTWDIEFLKAEYVHLFAITNAACTLDIKGLLDICCKFIANMLKERSVEEIRMTFSIRNDFSPEEEAAMREEDSWCLI